MVVLTPTVADPSLAPPGRHVVTAWAQWHAYELAGKAQRRDKRTWVVLDITKKDLRAARKR